eukprot:3517477-Rhodomonas_salina.3
MPGTDLAYGPTRETGVPMEHLLGLPTEVTSATGLRSCYGMPGTDAAYGASTSTPTTYGRSTDGARRYCVPAIVLWVCYAMSPIVL